MKKKIPFVMIKYFNTFLVILPFLVCWFAYYEPITMTTRSRQVSVLVIASYTIVFYWLCHHMDGFRSSILPLNELIFNQLISIAITDVYAFILIWMLSVNFPNVVPGLMAFLAQCLIVPLVCIYRYRSFNKSHPPLKALIIRDVRDDIERLITERELDGRFDVQGTLNSQELLKNMDLLDGMDMVFIFGIHSHERNAILKECIYRNVQLYIIPRVGDLLMNATEEMHLFHLPILRSKRYNPTTEYRVIKRLVDIVISLIGLVLLSPVFLVTAIAIKQDGGPVFYSQERLTQNGKRFMILKFRSMRVDSEKECGAVLSAGENDPRITSVGRVIRAFRIDELPQLLNILKGDMSIVGPRPERPEIAAKYEETLPEFALRLQAKAGLTGYAQVYGKYNSTPYDKLLMDLLYLSHSTLFQDMKIILETIRILFDKESTEGVETPPNSGEYENDERYYGNNNHLHNKAGIHRKQSASV